MLKNMLNDYTSTLVLNRRNKVSYSILIFGRYSGLSQMKLKSRHFENYPISGNQKP
jgi:hypothetical protein